MNNHSLKMVINTSATYTRTIVNGVVTLILTRIALNTLGVYDFGLYNLLAGSIALLSFLNSALSISAQRFFSIAIGSKKENLLKQYFCGSFLIHIILTLILILILTLIQPYLFRFVLNIEESKIHVAVLIYYIMVTSSALILLGVPFAALMNAFEDISIISYITILSYVIRLGGGIILLFIDSHKLVVYSMTMLLSVVFLVIIEVCWCRAKYSKITIWDRTKINKEDCLKLAKFAAWNTFGASSILIRDQGVAVTLNYYFGTILNAAYGIAIQVNSLVLSFAGNLTMVFAPAIIQAKGAENHLRMIKLAIFSSKISFILSCCMGLPLLLFLHEVLELWLNEIPPYTEIFCKYLIFGFIIQQLYPGINRMIYAMGKIKAYQISLFLIYTSVIPVGIILFKIGYSPVSIIVSTVIGQIGVLFSTLVFSIKYCNLSIKDMMVHSIIIPTAVFLLIYTLLSLLLTKTYTIIEVILYSIIIIIIWGGTAYKFILSKDEQSMLKDLYNILKSKISCRL